MAVGLALAALPLPAQSTGGISSRVIDPSGADIPGASVEAFLAGGETAILRTETTAEGLFRFAGVQAGLYDVAVEAPGFQRQVVRGVKVDAARETSLPSIVLELGAVTFTVEVEANLDSLQTSNAEISSTVTTEQIRRLPLLDRNPLRLVQTQAGVGGNRAQATTINGQRASFTNVTFDGVNIQDNFSRSNGVDFAPIFLVLDQVAEFTVTTSNSSAAVGGGASQISYVSPSGGNNFHGTAYWSHRNNALAANDWFANAEGNARPSFAQNQMGGTFNGPIIRDKLLFSQTLEIFRLPDQTQVLRQILTADARQGIFSYINPQGQLAKLDPSAFGIDIQSLIDPAMASTIAQTPGPEKINSFRTGDSLPGQPLNTGGYTFFASDDLKRENLSSRLDYLHSARNHFYGTFHWNHAVQDRPTLSRALVASFPVGNGFATESPVKDRRTPILVSATWRSNPTAQFTNELRGGFNRIPLRITNSEDRGDFYFEETGLLFSQAKNLYPSEERVLKNFSLQDNATWVRGAHSLRFGFQMQNIRAWSSGDNGIVPAVRLFGQDVSDLAPDMNALQQFDASRLYGNLLGSVSRVTQRFNVLDRNSGFIPFQPAVRNYKLDQQAWYFQDDWKVDPRLTLNIGVRYELLRPPNEANGLALMPVVQGGVVETLVSNHTLDLAGANTGRPFYNLDKNNFAPNIGLAWDIFGTGTTVLRGGYSIHYVNDEMLRSATFVTEAAEGLFVDAVGTAPDDAEILASDLETQDPILQTPQYQVPRTLAQNARINPTGFTGLIDPNFRTPYVQEWNFSVQHRLKGTIVEARYLGNQGVRLARTLDYGFPIIRENGLLDDFVKAQNNAQLAMSAVGQYDPRYNPGIQGSQRLPLFDSLPGGGLLTNPSVRQLLQTNSVAELAFFYQVNGLNGDVQMVGNPLAPLGAFLLTNSSNSIHHAMQLEWRRRSTRGVQMQLNYTLAKTLTDAVGTDNARFDPYLDPRNGRSERARASFDLKHAIKGNFIYELPFGKQGQFGAGRWKGLFGGWTVSGITTLQSGSPFSIVSGLATVNFESASSLNTVNTQLTGQEIVNLLGVSKSGASPSYIDASAISATGRGAADVFQNPAAGTVGTLQRRMFSGPWTFDFDMAMLKHFTIAEGKTLELRGEATNLFNNVSFLVFDQNINDPQFGRIQGTAWDQRRVQLTLYFRF
ncbi:MAG: TonB-dependent receptor [Acidobacteria bacterium]|nr:TonB-dependent receptor [Acidobacteriota bacterium]